MAAFPSPAAGHEEKFIGDTLHEHLVRKPSSTIIWLMDSTYSRMNLDKGDLLIIETDRRPHDACLALVDHEGERVVCQLFWRNERWYALTDSRHGRVTQDMALLGASLKTKCPPESSKIMRLV